MGDTLMTIKALHLDLESQFNLEHLFAILQGITGFVGGVAGKDPGAAISGALSIIEAEATRCNRGTLRENKDKIKKWLTFGKAYKALTDSSQLNFDEMDVQSVPEIMKVTQYM